VGQEASEDFLKQVEAEGFGVWRVPSLQKYVNPWKDLKALQALTRKFADRHYNLVHTHLAKAGILGRLAARWAGVPVIVHTAHGPLFLYGETWWEKTLYTRLERWAAGFTQAIVYVGEELRQRYLEVGIGTAEKSRLIYTGRNFDRYLAAARQSPVQRQARRASLGIKADDLVVGYVARVVPPKGHLYAIQAAQRLKERFPQVRFLFVGEANLPSQQHYKEKLRREAEQRGLQEQVIFLNHQNDIENYYAIFDVFILPSLYEGLPNVVLEAAVMGLPVVAFDCFGVREILGNQAHIVPLGDVDAFGRKLEEVLRKVPAEGRSTEPSPQVEELLQRWSIKAMVDAKDLLYRELLGGVSDA
jgi:glycosyltransferase involved in cell wall biosynthesis